MTVTVISNKSVVVDPGEKTISVIYGGANGVSAYVYIAYASDSSGTDFTTTFDADLNYIAIKATTTPITSPGAGDFTGLWKNYKGITGAQGDPGGDANHWAVQEVPTGDQDGSNKNFTLAHTPTGQLVCVYNGREMQNTVDYSYTGTALTLITFYPNASEGDRFWVRYPYA